MKSMVTDVDKICLNETKKNKEIRLKLCQNIKMNSKIHPAIITNQATKQDRKQPEKTLVKHNTLPNH
jgi:hypothetical protein